MIELLPRRQDIVRGALGLGVAGEEHGGGVRVAQGVADAQALGLLPIEPVRHGHHVLYDGLPELLHVRLGVAVAAHAVVPQGHEVLVAHGPAHLGPKGGELVVDVVELLLMLRIEACLGQPGLPAHGGVRALLVGPQLCQVQHLSLEGDLGGGDELAVGGDQLVLLLHIRDQLGIEGPELDGHVGEQEGAVFPFEIGPPGRAEQLHLGPLLDLLELGPDLVQALLFRGVEFILRVHAMADVTQGHGGLDPGESLLQGRIGPVRFRKALGVLQLLGVLLDLLPEQIHIRANIGHVRKQHGHSSSLMVPRLLRVVK